MNKKMLHLLLILLLFILPVFIQNTDSEEELDNINLRPNTEVIYYIDVMYDGIDKKGVESSNEMLASLYSDQIDVEDILPEGFLYNGYIEETDFCKNYTVDGVYYQERENKINFSVKNLQAGCKLSIGIKLLSQKSNSKIEQYSQAIAKYKNDFVTSNSIHTTLGTGKETFKINFTAQGIENYDKNILQTKQYAQGQIIKLNEPPTNQEYEFIKYTSSDVKIENNQFIMPKKDITINLLFKKKESHSIIFKIEGETPPNYEIPSTIQAYYQEIVELNDLQKKDKLNGYIFNGWESNITIENNKFIMPDDDVVIIGSFSKEIDNHKIKE